MAAITGPDRKEEMRRARYAGMARRSDPTGKACATSDLLPLLADHSHASKLYHMGDPPAGPALDAGRCHERAWRIHAAFAQRLRPQAMAADTVDEELGLDLTNTVYAPGLDDHTVPVGFP